MALEALTSYEKIILDDKCQHEYRRLMQHVVRDSSGLSLARRKDATCFLRWIMSVIPDATTQSCYQSAAGGRAFEKRVSSAILKVYQSAALENHAKLDEIRQFSGKKFDESPKPKKPGEYQYVSALIGISYSFFLDSETGAAYMNPTEKKKPSLGSLLEKVSEVISVPCSGRKV